VLASAGLFVITEVLLGLVLGNLVVGRYVSMSLSFMMQGLLNLASYFVGGFIIGVISPRIRILEPALGAALCVALMLGVTLFTPYSFLRFDTFKLLLGGGIAFVLALAGAGLGERLMGNR
jgi:hypothetical protein